MAAVAEFCVQSGKEPEGGLFYDNKMFSKYLVIDHGPDASLTEETIRKLSCIEECFPPLTDNYLSFRCSSPDSLEVLLKNPTFRVYFIRNGIMTDFSKHILRSLGFMAMQCFLSKVHLDWGLDKMFISGMHSGAIPRVKGIVIKECQDDGSFESWKVHLIDLFKAIGQEIFGVISGQPPPPKNDPDPELTYLIDSLILCQNVSEIQKVLDSWVFWTKHQRMSLMHKFGEVIAVDEYWSEGFPGFPCILNWQSTMSVDNIIKQLIVKHDPKTNATTDHSYYRVLQFNNLFLFLRAMQLHFRKYNPGFFPNELTFVVYLEQHFSAIMCELYKLCQAIQDKGTFKFGLDAQPL